MRPHHQPVALVLTRQDVPILDRSKYASAEGLRRGGYVLADSDGGDPEVILIATGSEVALAVAAHEELIADGVALAGRQPALLGAVRPPGRRATATRSCRPAIQTRVSVEEASTLGWDRYVGPEGAMIGMHTFGASAPLKDVQTKFGFTPDKVAEAAQGG